MSNKGKHWYNNGIEARMLYEDLVPNGYIKGNLKLNKEALKIRNLKFSDTMNSKSDEDKLLRRDRISKGNKGKNKGFNPWNKGAKGLLIAWNKGLTGIYTRSEEAKLKEIETKRKNNSFNTSKPEEEYYKYLLSMYSEDDIIRQYRSSVYPFNCDFYIKSKDLYIECNYHWSHNKHPFNINSIKDCLELSKWSEKAKTSQFYKNAIYTWTILDTKKQRIAKENNLNYKIIY